jgi:hypothetical protein
LILDQLWLYVWRFSLSFQPFFDKLVKRKWLNNTVAFEAIEASIKQNFKKFRRMDPPPYQVQLKFDLDHSSITRLQWLGFAWFDNSLFP